MCLSEPEQDLQLIYQAAMQHGRLGSNFALRRWLRAIHFTDSPSGALSVVVVRRKIATPYTGFSILRQEGIPFQAILVESLPAEQDAAAPLAEYNDSGKPDIHLILDTSSPAYAPYNLGALCASAPVLVFLDGEAKPQVGLLAAYQKAFQQYPGLMAARGIIKTPVPNPCPGMALGSFALDATTTFWPVDLDENMAIQTKEFFALGGFDESLKPGYGAVDLSIRLFELHPQFARQRYIQAATAIWAEDNSPGLPFPSYLFQRQNSWRQLNTRYKGYLPHYLKFWQESALEQVHG